MDSCITEASLRRTLASAIVNHLHAFSGRRGALCNEASTRLVRNSSILLSAPFVSPFIRVIDTRKASELPQLLL